MARRRSASTSGRVAAQVSAEQNQAPSSSGTGPVTTRAFRVLEAFSAERRELTLTELARQAALPLSTAHRLVSELTQWGALERNAEGLYRIGLRLWEVASLAPRGLALRETAMPYMEDLSQVTQENVQLAVREGLEVVFVERIAGRRAVPTLTRVGGRFPMHPTGVGLVLLAHAPVEVQEEVLAAPLARFTPRTLTQPHELRRVLAEVRRLGYVVSDRQVSMETVSVAAPVWGADGTVVAAMSIVIRVDGVQPSSLVPAVQAAARGISRALGAPDLRRRRS
jgi:DNA-binding IclR family transcriptional regulator